MANECVRKLVHVSCTLVVVHLSLSDVETTSLYTSYTSLSVHETLSREHMIAHSVAQD